MGEGRTMQEQLSRATQEQLPREPAGRRIGARFVWRVHAPHPDGLKRKIAPGDFFFGSFLCRAAQYGRSAVLDAESAREGDRQGCLSSKNEHGARGRDPAPKQTAA